MKPIKFFLHIMLLLVAVSFTAPVFSQNSQYALYNYRNDGNFNAWLNVDIEKITYSCIDTLGVEHDDIVVQEVWTADSVYRIPLEAIDSIGFRAPETKFKVGVFIIDEKQLPYIIDADNLSISFMQSTPSDKMPVKGQVVYSDLVEDPFYMGFAGRVIEIERNTDVVKYICEPVLPGEVYERCVEIIKISGDEDDFLQVDGSSRTRISPKTRNIADEGIIKIPSLKASASIKGVGVSAKFTYTIDYAFSVGITDRDFASLKVTRESEYSADLDIKLEKAEGYSEETWLPWPIYTLGAGNKIGFSVNAGLFFDLKGSTNLTAKIPYKSTHVDFYTWSSDAGFQHLENKEGGWPGWNEFLTGGDVKLKVKGSVAFGPILEASFQIWKPSFLSIDARAKAGLELSGELSLDLKEIVTDGLDFYKTVSEDMKITTGLKIGGEIGYTIKDKFEKILGADATFFKTERYFFPRFTEPKMPDYISGEWEGGCEPMAVFTQPSNLIFFPGKVGLGVYDVNNECLGYTHSDNYFFGGDKDDWEKSWLQCDISKYVKDKPSGSQLYIHPLFDMLGILEFKGSPKAVVTIPEPLSLGLNVLNIEKGKTKSVLITGGWGEYSASVLDKTKFSADIRKSGDNTYVEIVGLSEGSTTVTIKDLRTEETKVILVKVTSEPINQSTINVNTKNVDFGTVKEEETKTEYFSVVNSGNYDLIFMVDKASAPFDIPEAGIEFTLSAGDSKVFAVTCKGQKSDNGTKSKFIHISSDASNDSPDFGVTLTANVEVKVTEEEAPYIPVQTETFVVKGVPFTMVGVEGGSFMMGSPDDDPDAGGIYSDEKPQHRVELSNFAIGQTEVTQALWKVVMGDNPSTNIGYKKPVEQVSWDLCQAFISKLNVLTGRTFRLPTEAEWEYAARGGNNSKGYKFAGSNDIDEVAWNINNSEGTTHVVGAKNPNELGLYDMSGNVLEWCQDWWDDKYYSKSPAINPCNTTEISSNKIQEHQHIHRGGSIEYIIKDLRVAMRGDFENESSLSLKGLRLALSDGKTGYNKTEAEDDAYAVYDSGTFSFYCDKDRYSKYGETYDMPDYWDSPDWRDIRESVKRVIFDSSFAKARPKCTMGWFSGMNSITEVEGLQYLNTSEVTCMSEMFYKCSSLKTLDVSHFNTSKVTCMAMMFDECNCLTTLDVSHFNTTEVTEMQSMFRYCSSLESLDVSNFDTSNTTKMYNMFAKCPNLTTLDVSGFNTSNVKDMSSMFYGCSGLSRIDVSGFNTSNVKDMSYMFYGCSGLSRINLSSFNTSIVYNMMWMFGGCSSLTNLDISRFDTSGIAAPFDEENYLQGLFYGCNNLKTIYCGDKWNVQNTEFSSSMFEGCTSLIGGKGTKYDSNHTNGEYARIDGGSDKPGYFTEANAVIGDEDAFCLSESSIDIYVNTDKVVDIKNGSGEYEIINDYPDIISADINGIHVAHSRDQYSTRTIVEYEEPIKDDLLYITGKKIGNAVLKIKDKSTDKIVSIDVAVINAPSLTLAKNNIELSVGNTENVEILTGSEWYEVTTDQSDVVSVHKSTITSGGAGRDEEYTSYTGIYAVIEALSVGEAVVTVKDLSSGETVEIKVKVS